MLSVLVILDRLVYRGENHSYNKLRYCMETGTVMSLKIVFYQ